MKDIVIIGTLGSYENLVGQRGRFLAEYYLSGNHNVLFLEYLPSKTDHKINKYVMSGNWLNNSYNTKLMADNLRNQLKQFCKNKERIVLFEIPLSGYIELIPIFKEFGFKIVYDVIDYWKGFFGGEFIDVDSSTKILIKSADYITATSTYLQKMITEKFNKICYLIPNGFNHLKDVQYNFIAHNFKINVVYVGAIGEWFDWRLIKSMLDKYPNIMFHIFGVYGERKEFPAHEWNRLIQHKNFRYYGKVDRIYLKSIIDQMDYCMIPFTDSTLIEATDPIKAYEYISCYKKILVPDYMKELNRFPKETIIHYNKNFDFNQLKKADNCLNEKEIDIFLNQSLWSSRAEAILKPKLYTAKTKELKYNIIMLSYNTNELTKNAIIKLHENSFHGFNLFVLDNNSNDGSQAMLFDLYRNKLIDGLILNNKNSGFGRSNNIVFNTFNNNLKHTLFINSDTVVSENFDEHIFNWFIDNVGVVACSGDNIGAVNNPQRNNNKTGIIELERFSGFAFFILNSLFKKLNGFDEQFFCYFEDDDLSIRVTKEGYKIICDYSCFVHHEMGKSNSDLKAHELIFQDSRAKFLQKWPKAEVVR